MEKQEIRIVLDETNFTTLCKTGFFTFQSKNWGKTDVHIYKIDMKNLAIGSIITKDIGDEIFKIVIGNLKPELIKEIIKRSPIYSEMYYEL